MKLIEFSVKNYRSITDAHRIVLQDKTVLVGKNNEGKSNLLTALNTAMEAMIYHSVDEERPSLFYRDMLYNWNRDFPIQLQGRSQGTESIFKLHFRLEDDEVVAFQDFTKIRSNEDIPVTVKFGKDNKPKIYVPKRGSSSYNKKSKQVTDFISKRIYFNYIQAVRTEDMAIEALQNVIWDELQQLKNNDEYVEAQQKVDSFEQQVLNNLAEQLKNPLSTFIPNIKDISIMKSKEYRYFRRMNGMIDVLINDGQLTSIANKGDGIKSLVTLAVLKERSARQGASIIAIEEPESHLHSGAIHSLIEVINTISKNSQVIITTHNPLFVQQNQLSANILVDSGKARPAKNIEEIRELLGVMPSDNLHNSRFVLLVEGEDDKKSMEKILSLKSSKIRYALQNNILIIKPLRGASNLTHDALDLKNALCSYVVLLDNDKAGKDAFEKAKAKGAVTDSNVRFTTCRGMAESEFEDCLKPSLYSDTIWDEFKVKLEGKNFKNSNKWSERVKTVFTDSGMTWSDRVEEKVKCFVAEQICMTDNLEEILIEQKSGFIDGLVGIVEEMISCDC